MTTRKKYISELAQTSLDVQHVFNGCRATGCLESLDYGYPTRVLVMLNRYEKLEAKYKKLKAKQ